MNYRGDTRETKCLSVYQFALVGKEHAGMNGLCRIGINLVTVVALAAGAEIYSKSAKGWQRRALLAPAKAEKAARLRAVKI